MGELLHADISGVPFTVIGNQYIIGWQSESTTGRDIEQAIQNARAHNLPDAVADLTPGTPGLPLPSLEPRVMPEKLALPFFGEVNIKYFSLGLITLMIGALDGFNPCAMWVLVFLINLLLGMEDRKKMWILGSAFIISSGVIYFLFMSAWLNLLVFLGYILWVRIIIGIIALFAGAYNLKDYITETSGACKLNQGDHRQKRMERMKEVIQTRKFWLALGGIIILAFAVNLVELICSAGFPVVYLQILSLTPIPFWQYYLYLLLYIVIFMLDDIIVFVVAMITFRLIGVTTRYKRISSLIGGILMCIIGILLIFKPGYLMFG